ncbi:MAG TPA: sugar phosphate isomerase/epimerase [Roseiflexaceae bacterium]|jgi:sugar phosphate isomerase/epimerase
MKFGACIWPFQWEPPYEATLRRIAGLGFRAVELIAWDRQTLDDYYTPQRVQTLRRLLADEGLELSEFVSTPPGMASPDPGVRAHAIDHFKRLVDVGVALGARLVNTVAPTPFDLPFPRITQKHLLQEWSLDVAPDLDWRQNWADYVQVMQRCCAICEDAGIRYALEPHPYRWMRNAASMLRLLDQVGSPALGMNVDPSHLFPMGELSEMVIYEVGDRVFHTHLSDNDGTSNVHWRPGKGKIDWRGVLQALQAVGYDYVLSIELEDVPGVAHAGRASTEMLDQEVLLAKVYLTQLCQELGIAVEA